MREENGTVFQIKNYRKRSKNSLPLRVRRAAAVLSPQRIGIEVIE
jgi:hypothetical protein